jgi:hypothetical protein
MKQKSNDGRPGIMTLQQAVAGEEILTGTEDAL